MPSKYDAPEYEASQGGTFPDDTSWAAGDVVARDRIPEADRHRLIQAGVFLPYWRIIAREEPEPDDGPPAETESEDDAPS